MKNTLNLLKATETDLRKENRMLFMFQDGKGVMKLFKFEMNLDP